MKDTILFIIKVCLIFYVGKYLIKSYKPLENIIIKDVAIINGYDNKLAKDPFNYRILNIIEQLNASILEFDIIDYCKFKPLIIRNYRVIILYYCPLDHIINETIQLSKELNKKILIDIDDLVMERKYIELMWNIDILSSKHENLYDIIFKSMKSIIFYCDAVITNTQALEKELKNYFDEVFINGNAANE